MKFLAVFGMLGLSLSQHVQPIDKCHRLPKRGSAPRYTTPRSIERGNDQPAAISFLIEKRSTLMEIFARGHKKSDVMDTLISDNLPELSNFAFSVDDPYLGQHFRWARQQMVDCTHEGQMIAEKNLEGEGAEFAALWRDNSQRIAKMFRDMVYNPIILEKMRINTDFMAELEQIIENDMTDGAKTYRNFVKAHGRKIVSFIKENDLEMDVIGKIEKIVGNLKNKLFKVLQDEERKTGYRQLINELPLVYQFFNDNIDYIMMANMDKTLDEAIARDIMMTLAKDHDDQHIGEMINRNAKFIKKLMTQRAEKQMEERAVSKVMEKNAELKAAIDNEAEFNRIVAERKKAGEEITKEMEKEIWSQVKADNKQKQKDQIGNQLANKDAKHSPKKGMTRYQHLSAILALFPDELLETCADMVMQSCPELDLTEIDTPEMKAVVEEQPVQFLDQLIEELHDVCEMFGLIDEDMIDTIMTKNIDGEEVEVDIYSHDWTESEKKVW